MTFLARLSMKPETSTLKVAITRTAAPIKEKVCFCYHRLAKGINDILLIYKCRVSVSNNQLGLNPFIV